MDEEYRIAGLCPYCSLPVFDPPYDVNTFTLIDSNDVAWHGLCAQQALSDGTRIRTKRFAVKHEAPMAKKKKKSTKCIGYGEFEGQCDQDAGTPWTTLWCMRCDELRREMITESLEKICAKFNLRES